MGLPAIGAVLLVNFPFADLKKYKKRPAVVIASGSLNTIILCQVTSRNLPKVPGVKLAAEDFLDGGLALISYVRPDKLFTIDSTTPHQYLGTLRSSKVSTIRQKIKQLFNEDN